MIPFYLNVVGYKVYRQDSMIYTGCMFYLNVVGYKVIRQIGVDEDAGKVLSERSGI